MNLKQIKIFCCLFVLKEFLNRTSSSTTKQITKSELQVLEEELLKVKMREAETVSEMKSMNLKLMQMETEVKIYMKPIFFQLFSEIRYFT